MEKLQMTVTLVESDLITYLQQFPSARERSFVLRMLARQGLQAMGMAVANGTPRLPIPGFGVAGSSAVLEGQLAIDARSSPGDTAPLQVASVPASVPAATPEPVIAPVIPPAVTATTLATAKQADTDAQTRADADTPADALAGIDVAALTQALTRY